MRCTGLTVVHGVDIASFDVDVIDVVAGQPPEDPRILIRVSGPTVEGTGVAEGFSGSPVYCAGETASSATSARSRRPSASSARRSRW